ncbi:MAG: hypothetical protein HYX92_21700 [Chloroflexi bacterium]|nr:hypothetical protein [Chloroflexota bacterium]
MTFRGNAGEGILEVLGPVALVGSKAIRPASRLGVLSGCKIGLYWNTKPGGDLGLEEVARLLEERFQDLKFERFSCGHPHGKEILEKVAKSGCDAIIGATAD